MTDVKQALQKASKRGTLSGLKSDQIQTVLAGWKNQMVKALPKHLTADRMIQMSTQLIARNPKIAECSVSSVIGAVMQASILGFKPVESLGYCYFVPYKGQLSFQIGYKGYIQLAHRSGEVKMIYAEVVRENDFFEYKLGLEPKLEHEPKGDNGKITHTYAVVHYKDGGYNFIVMNKSQIERTRLTSPSQGAQPSGAWKDWYDQMAKAKVIKQLSSYMPLDEEMETAAISDEKVVNAENFKEGEPDLNDFEEVEGEETPNKEAPQKSPTPAAENDKEPPQSKPKQSGSKKATSKPETKKSTAQSKVRSVKGQSQEIPKELL